MGDINPYGSLVQALSGAPQGQGQPQQWPQRRFGGFGNFGGGGLFGGVLNGMRQPYGAPQGPMPWGIPRMPWGGVGTGKIPTGQSPVTGTTSGQLQPPLQPLGQLGMGAPVMPPPTGQAPMMPTPTSGQAPMLPLQQPAGTAGVSLPGQVTAPAPPSPTGATPVPPPGQPGTQVPQSPLSQAPYQPLGVGMMGPWQQKPAVK